MQLSSQAKPVSPAPAMGWQLPFMSVLLLVSGACALVYQTAWLREFRLIFGGATAATAAVLAVFMGGLGVGGAWLGRRAERSPDLLRMYAGLEIGIGVSAALTPWLLEAVRWGYLRTGGVLVLGPWGALVAHLLLATLVLAGPCILLGGNLPPAVKWVQTDEDRQRGALGMVYGFNAMGAVLGVLFSTFWALEHLGTRQTLWMAAGIHVLLGVIAGAVARRNPTVGATPVAAPASSPAPVQVSASIGGWRGGLAFVPGGKAPARFVYWATGVAGFTFFLSELVWFRMLTPLLGGSVYCFGLILAGVLAGIGVGGWLYRGRIANYPGRVHLGTFAVLATAQAAFLALPLALGDRVAVTSFHLQQLRSLGFPGLLAGWGVTTGLLVLAPAVLAGLQFPLLVGLLGEGRREAARQVGTAYAANTAGAIAGSVLGGFVLLPWLTAPGCWRLAAALMLALGFAALLAWERPWRPSVVMGTLGLGAATVGFAFYSMGPTGAWRHTALGYGIVKSLPASPAGLEDQLRAHRREVAREYEGREASIAVTRGDEGWALFSNGKADGSALADAGTQVMLGLIGALQHPGPRSAFLIGLGTGTSAGWLADVPGMDRVDVVELEPRVVDVARDYFGAVNRTVMSKTNVQVILGDAREVLLVTDRTYDLIVSEPPNPYRAGVSSLFTRDYYRAVERRLAPGGIFSQWLQGYQLSSESVQVVYATLLSVFPYVETWVTQGSDLLFVCHRETPDYPVERLRERLTQAPFQEALARAWFVGTVEGVMARHFAGARTARQAAARAEGVSTDDRNLLEYGVARTQLGGGSFHYRDLLAASLGMGDDVPAHLRGGVEPGRLLEARVLFLAMEGDLTEPPPSVEGEALARASAMVAWSNGDHGGVLSRWQGMAYDHGEQLMLAISASRAGAPEVAQPLLEAVRRSWPAEAAIGSAWLAFRHGDGAAAVGHVTEAFEIMRQHPWVLGRSLLGLVELTFRLGPARPQDAATLLAAWRTPLAAGLLERSAPEVWYRLAFRLPLEQRLEVLEAVGPHHPWTRDYLAFRLSVLEEIGHPLARSARQDLARLVAEEGLVFTEAVTALPAAPVEPPVPAAPAGRGSGR